MFCSECGTEVQETAKFCHNCGNNLQNISSGTPVAQNQMVCSQQEPVAIPRQAMLERDQEKTEISLMSNIAGIFSSAVQAVTAKFQKNYNHEDLEKDFSVCMYVFTTSMLRNGLTVIWAIEDLAPTNDSDEEAQKFVENVMEFVNTASSFKLNEDISFQATREYADFLVGTLNDITNSLLLLDGRARSIFSGFIIDVEPAVTRFTNELLQIIQQDMGISYQNLVNCWEKLKSFSQFYNNSKASGWADIGLAFVKNFGAGALAAANPLIGIPLLAANWLSTNKDDKAREQTAEAFGRAFEDFCNAVEAVREKRVDCINRVRSHINSKLTQVFSQLELAIDEYVTIDNTVSKHTIYNTMFLAFANYVLRDLGEEDREVIEFTLTQQISEHFRTKLKEAIDAIR